MILVMALLVTNNGVSIAAETQQIFTDTETHWAKDTIESWSQQGLIKGYPDGTARPDQQISRAELVTLINRIFGFEEGNTAFSDVTSTDWYYADITKAVNAGYLNQDPQTAFGPDVLMTREEAVNTIANAFKLVTTDEVGTFDDDEQILSAYRANIYTMQALGYVQGYPDGEFKPKAVITRAEIVKVFDNIVDAWVVAEGVTENQVITGNMVVNHEDVILKDLTIEGDLYLAEGIGEGDVSLDNVTVIGTTYINGGGENSITMNDCVLGNIVVNKNNGTVRLVVSGKTIVLKVTVESSAKLEELDLEDAGFQEVNITGDNSVAELIGTYDFLQIDGSNVTITMDNGVILELEITEEGVSINDEPVTTGVFADVVNGVIPEEGTSSGSTSGSSSVKEWTMVWNDEFNGTEIDLTKWTYDIGNYIVDDQGAAISAGWGNNELEYYTDSSNNSYIEDGNLVIQALEETTADAFGTYDYTSAKLKSNGLYSQKYGRYEIKAKFPEGAGLWPAIWMLPEDNVYGAWASSGEIDIFEGWGSDTSKAAGTLHYGGVWPNNKYSGKDYHFEESSSTMDFHEYALEWEPGEIRWYVDDVLYQTQNNWNAVDGNDEKFSFPAPFDEEFYFIMNLAVGGTFDGDPTDQTAFPSKMEVDYVRAYELTGRDYMTPVEPVVEAEAFPAGAKVPAIDGNYISNGDFTAPIQDNADASLDFSDEWNFVHLADFGGDGDATIEDIGGSNYAKIDVTNAGSQSYSVQMIQLTTLGKGRYYTLSFDAKASASRDVSVKLSGGADAGWTAYSDNYSMSLTDTVQSYEETFQMTAESDIAARLEFNLGLNTDDVWIGNVALVEVDAPEVDYDAAKAVLADGNSIYNGSFDKETIDRMAYWNFTTDGAVATASISESTRELKVDISNGGNGPESIILDQKGIKVTANKGYKLAFEAKAEVARAIQVSIVSKDGTVEYLASEAVNITDTMTQYEIDFTMSETTDLESQLIFEFGGEDSDVYLDNVSLKATSVDYSSINVYPLENGSFSDGLDNWAPFVMGEYESWSPSDATFTTTGGAVEILIDNTGGNDWEIQFNQENINLNEKVTYEVSFEVSSTIGRQIDVTIENAGYDRYFEATGVTVTTDAAIHIFEFEMPKDDTVNLKFLLGNVGGAEALGSHTITIDNVICQVKTDVINGAFDDGNTAWGSWYADWEMAAPSISVIDAEMKAAIDSEGSQFWSIQIFQENVLLEDGEIYVLVFDAKSTVARKIQPIIENMVGGEKYLLETTSLTDELQSFSYEFEMNSDASGKLIFALGKIEDVVGLPHDVIIDHVSLIKR